MLSETELFAICRLTGVFINAWNISLINEAVIRVSTAIGPNAVIALKTMIADYIAARSAATTLATSGRGAIKIADDVEWFPGGASESVMKQMTAIRSEIIQLLGLQSLIKSAGSSIAGIAADNKLNIC
jgi:hypothetical protein